MRVFLILTLFLTSCGIAMAQEKLLEKEFFGYVIRKIVPDARRDIGDVKHEKYVLYRLASKDIQDHQAEIFIVENGVTKSVRANPIRTFQSGEAAREFAKENKITDTPFAEIADCQIIRVVETPMFGQVVKLEPRRIVLLNTCFEIEHDSDLIRRTEITRNGKITWRNIMEVRVFNDRNEAEIYAKENDLFDVDYSFDSKVGKIDVELNEALQTAMRGEVSSKSINKFKQLLKEKLKNPVTFNYSLINLAASLNIRTSPDKRLKFYSWDNRTGGTRHNMTVIAQHKDDKGQIQVNELNDPHLDKLPKQTDFIIKEIYEIKVKNKTHYLTIGWGTSGNGQQFDIVKVFRIRDRWLFEDSSMLPEKRDLIIVYPRSNSSGLTFNPMTNEISFREFIEDKDSGFMQLTGKIIMLKLLNEKFTRK